jgi:hypothetical protein
MANILIADILKEVNADINNIKKHAGNNYLRNMFEHAYLPEKKFLLPEGVPSFKAQLGPSVQHEQSFFMECKKLYVYCRADLKPIRRETMFISCLESLSEEEAKIFIAVKEQNLQSLYPNITLEALKEVGYLK